MRARVEHGVCVYELAPESRAVVKRKSNLPLVTIAIAVRGGANVETPTTAGLTGLMMRTSIKGTRDRTAVQIAEIAESLGGSISPAVGPDLLEWEITVPSRHFDTALDLLCDVAFRPAFRQDDFEIERKLSIADIQQSRDDMFRYPLRLCMQQAFRDHPYGNTITDIERTIAAATSENVAAWHAQHVQVCPWAFVVGDVDPDETARRIAQVFPSHNGSGPPQARTPQWHGGATDSDEREKAQTALALAFPGPTRNHADVHAMHVLTNAIGGLGGRFFEELRSKRSLAYTISIRPIARWLGGAFIAYIATSPEREEEARRVLLEQFERLVEEVLPATDVERSQRYTIGARQIRSQTNTSQLTDLMHAYLLGSGASEITEFEQHIMTVTPAMIMEAARRYFDPALVVQGIVRGKEPSNAR